MDENDGSGSGISSDHRQLLSQFAARRAARNAVAAGVPSRPNLEQQLREMDDVFAGHPNPDDPLVQENHELRRYTAILEAALIAALSGETTIPAA
jgi:hypothetical protein